MIEKKDHTISLAATESLHEKLNNLAQMQGVTLSKYLDRVLASHVAEKEAEARLLAEALGIHLKDI